MNTFNGLTTTLITIDTIMDSKNIMGGESGTMKEVEIPLEMYQFLERMGDPQEILITLVEKELRGSIFYC